MRQRRPLLIIVAVIIVVLALGIGLVPGFTAQPAPLSCPHGEIILNGVHQCAP